MAFLEYVNDYFEKYPDFLAELQSLEKRRGVRLLARLLTDKDEINFQSWLPEARFGVFFDPFYEDLRYDANIDGKTPDWMLTMNGQKILAEVLRINTPEQELKQTLEQNRQLVSYQKKNPDAALIVHGKIKILAPEYLYGAQGKLEKKEETYRQIILKHNLPFIICVAPRMETYINEQDLFDFLIGHNRKGFFFQDTDFSKNVSGMLLRRFYGETFYFHNEMAQHQLSQQNQNVFSKIKYTEEI